MENSLESETEPSIKKRSKDKLRNVISQLIYAGLFFAALIIPGELYLQGSTGIVFEAGFPILVLSAWALAIVAHIRKPEEFERALAINSFAITFGALSGRSLAMKSPLFRRNSSSSP